jgi:hypothetical protein
MAIRINLPLVSKKNTSDALLCRKRSMRGIAALVVAVGICISTAHAEDTSIQSLLFADCEKAHESFAKLPPEGKSGLVDYLTRVVGLNTQAPAAPEVFAVLPNGKGMEPNPPALWQTTDAKRELRGKRCALELLTIAGPLAFNAVPLLASLYSEQALSDEIAVGIEETAASIAEQAHKNGQAPSDETMDKLMPFLISERPLVTQNFLQEYLSLSLPRVLTHLSAMPQPEASKVIDFLRDVDPDGARAMRGFVELVPRLTTENANRLASYLPFPSKEGAGPLVSDFARLAAEPTHGTNVTALLAKSCVLLGGILLDPALSSTLGRNPLLLRDSHLSEIEQRCLVSSVPSLANSLLPLLTSSQESDQRRALDLLPVAMPRIDTERRNLLFNKIKDVAHQPTSPLRRDAIIALSVFTDRRTDVQTFLSGLIKSSLAEKPKASQDEIVDAAFHSASLLSTPKDANRYSALVMEALKKGIKRPGVMALAAKIDSIEAQVVSLISPSNTEASLVMLNGLKDRKNLSKSSLTTIAETLRDPNLSLGAEALLISQGPSIVPLLRKTLLKSSTTQRLGILALLEAFGAASKAERLELLNTLVAGDSCQPLYGRPKTVQSLLVNGDVDKALYEQFTTKVARCLCGFKQEDGATLTRTSAAALLSPPDIIQSMLSNTKECGHLQPDLVAVTEMDSVPEATRSHLLLKLLELGERKTVLDVLASLSRAHPLAEQALPGVRGLAASIRNDPALAYAAVLTLARLGDTQFEWSPFVRDVIDMPESNQNFKTTLEIVRALPPEVVLTEVGPALESDNPDRVAGACRVGATLGSLAIPIVSKVWNLRDRKSPTIKYAAILALLEINPLTPDLHEGLRAILVNRYYRAALARPIQWRQSVAVVDLDKSAFGTLRTVHLERLLLK